MPAPFGKGEQTIIDKAVRSTQQIEPSVIDVRNPAFTRWLAKVVSPAIGASMGLDVEMGVRLNLYKLLLYKEGDHFLPHKDTPKESGMVGTVAIVLPSD